MTLDSIEVAQESYAVFSLIETSKLIAEGSGAVSLVAILADKIKVDRKNIVCLNKWRKHRYCYDI